MDRVFVECSALGFQAVLTILLALAYLWLWRRQHRPYFLTWSLAWTFYAARLAFMSAFLVERQIVWLFAHQACTDLVALLLLLAAVQFSRGVAWRARYLWLGAVALAWSYTAIYRIGSMEVASTSAAALLFAVTLWTSILFWRYQRATGSGPALLLAWIFLLWALHHLDYPLLRSFGTATFYTVFVDVLIIVAVTIGTLFLVLGEERRKLAMRTTQLEQLTRLLLRAQEDERRRIARELHDETCQTVAALGMKLDAAAAAPTPDGMRERLKEARAFAGRTLAEVHALIYELRPSVLDDLGLFPAIRWLADHHLTPAGIAFRCEVCVPERSLSAERQTTLFRAIQEAMRNVARHSGATQVLIQVEERERELLVEIEDDGHGFDPASVAVPKPTGRGLGLLGMRERLSIVHGSVEVFSSADAGTRVLLRVPFEEENPRG